MRILLIVFQGKRMFTAKLPGVSGVFRVMLAVSAGCQTPVSDDVKAASQLKAGSIITFGRYPQTESGEIKPIEWRVLEVKDNKALLLADKGLDTIPYDLKYAYVTWETSSVRQWLNTDFYNAAFNGSEKSRIAIAVLKNPDNPKNGTSGGGDTSDRIFLLSLDEVRWYFNQDGTERISRIPYAVNGGILKATPYAVKKGTWVSSDELQSSWWWLRSPGMFQDWASTVLHNGMLDFGGFPNYEKGGTVRPALWVRFETSNP